MHNPQCREDIFRLLEPTPAYLFALVLYGIGNIEFAGWIGTFAALLVLIGFLTWKVQFNPLVLGINVHLLILTPLIILADSLAYTDLRVLLIRHSFRGVLISMFLVGVILTCFSRNGMIGRTDLPTETIKKYSLIVLGACLAAIIWAFFLWQSRTTGVELPIVGLFILRSYLAKGRKFF